ncbi:MAG: hypothetical protein RJB22_1959 [Pseudomonadota bacterium]|jgi:hypothetical protein
MSSPSQTPAAPADPSPAPPASSADRPYLTDDENPFGFDHVRLRFRHDGWTPERQERFIEALAATGCVEHAARAVGKSVSSAYALKTRAEAQPFRLAWEAALEVGIKRLSEAALSRAIHGVPYPIFYKGEQVGERRHFDERLTMFLLRYRDPARHGAWIDHVERIEEDPDGAPVLLRQLMNRMMDRLFGDMGDEATRRSRKAKAKAKGRSGAKAGAKSGAQTRAKTTPAAKSRSGPKSADPAPATMPGAGDQALGGPDAATAAMPDQVASAAGRATAAPPAHDPEAPTQWGGSEDAAPNPHPPMRPPEPRIRGF